LHLLADLRISVRHDELLRQRSWPGFGTFDTPSRQAVAPVDRMSGSGDDEVAWRDGISAPR
jgi:hypothetical protein